MVDDETELQFCNALHDKKFSDLEPNELKEFVTFLNDNKQPDNDCIIQCYGRTKNVPSSDQHRADFPYPRRQTMRPKRDSVVIINECSKCGFGVEKKVSLKSGDANSDHQEYWKYFSKLLENLGADKKEIDAFSDLVHSRDLEYFKKHTNEKKLMQDFLDSNKEELITHFLKTGYCSEEGYAEYVFHGKKGDILSDCVFASTDSMIKKIMSTASGEIADLYLGAFTLQRWNVTTVGKLDSIQCKMGKFRKYMN